MHQTPYGPCSGLGRAECSRPAPPAVLAALLQALWAHEVTQQVLRGHLLFSGWWERGMGRCTGSRRPWPAGGHPAWQSLSAAGTMHGLRNPPGGGRSPLLSVLQIPIGGLLVSVRGAICQPVVPQPRSWSGLTQGRCARDGFGFLQQTGCFNEEE